jgi:transposase-like protein
MRVAVAAASHRDAIGPRALASGERTPIELAQDFGVHPNQIKQWRDQQREGATGILAIA